ncbi:MAG TPA: serine/threonine-protein kinase [Gemmataceae bacterium]|nr:serine/threonine-protein kinase [Gemmataceae bacterium]
MDATSFDPAKPAPRSPSDPLHEPRSLGEYRILRRLGEGGMGAVYLAFHEKQGHQVAIKVLGEHLATNQDFVDRFYREAKSGALLNHPNIVRTVTVGQDRATYKHYLVLEFVDGPSSLALLQQRGPLPVGDAVHVALDIARALEHAHSRNIVHRDIKPDNILLTRSGVAKLADLGLAKRTDEASHLTAARQGFGTSYYMPYEQAVNAKKADGRSDIYALGATLYHLLTGQVPFPGENHIEVVEKKMRGDFPPASSINPQVPPALDRILKKMLARDPRDRYQTASELIVDLERTGLAAQVPSFADADLARQDPWVQACLASANQATRPDLEAPQRKRAAEDVWRLRYRDRQGRWCRIRVTTPQLLQRLREGRLPAEAEICRSGQDTFRPVSAYPEFYEVIAVRESHRKPKRSDPPSNGAEVSRDPASKKGRPPTDAPSEGKSAARGPGLLRRWGWWLVAAGVGAGLLAGGLAAVGRLLLGST